MRRVDETKANLRRSTAFVVFGFLFLIASGLLGYAVYKYLTVTPAEVYTYNILQSVRTDVSYADNSFFVAGPTASDTAYVSDLTNEVTADFHYAYNADSRQVLNYTYSTEAVIRSTYGLAGNDTASNVWTKKIPLGDKITKTAEAQSFVIDESAAIPYQEYKAIAEQFRTGFALPVNTEAYVELTVKVSGEYQGAPFSDTQTARVAVPLNVQLYEPAVTYEKNITKTVASAVQGSSSGAALRYGGFVASLLLMLSGITFIIYGFRSQLFKSAYRRELERIYRYHDGIIVRAGRPVRLDGRQIVEVASFDDLLNLEEELKKPIVAATLDTQSTRFLINSGDIFYVYTLGETVSAEEGEV
ncbi:hypothetical protein B7Z28_00910, partial [Candidatus Saccharibacteria bacterium 32-45-3]